MRRVGGCSLKLWQAAVRRSATASRCQLRPQSRCCRKLAQSLRLSAPAACVARKTAQTRRTDKHQPAAFLRQSAIIDVMSLNLNPLYDTKVTLAGEVAVFRGANAKILYFVDWVLAQRKITEISCGGRAVGLPQLLPIPALAVGQYKLLKIAPTRKYT